MANDVRMTGDAVPAALVRLLEMLAALPEGAVPAALVRLLEMLAALPEGETFAEVEVHAGLSMDDGGRITPGDEAIDLWTLNSSKVSESRWCWRDGKLLPREVHYYYPDKASMEALHSRIQPDTEEAAN